VTASGARRGGVEQGVEDEGGDVLAECLRVLAAVRTGTVFSAGVDLHQVIAGRRPAARWPPPGDSRPWARHSASPSASSGSSRWPGRRS
jgi:hypothetical protein